MKGHGPTVRKGQGQREMKGQCHREMDHNGSSFTLSRAYWIILAMEIPNHNFLTFVIFCFSFNSSGKILGLADLGTSLAWKNKREF